MTIQSCRPLLNVIDCARSVVFYRDVLGFSVADTFEADGALAWALLKAGAAELMLNQNGRTGTERHARAGYTDVVLYFQVASVHALHHELVRHGVTPSEPEAQAYGVDEMYLRDPDGYELAFTSPSDLSRRS
jgi:uncharacterized glyoxalase superfamily protein PhnB